MLYTHAHTYTESCSQGLNITRPIISIYLSKSSLFSFFWKSFFLYLCSFCVCASSFNSVLFLFLWVLVELLELSNFSELIGFVNSEFTFLNFLSGSWDFHLSQLLGTPSHALLSFVSFANSTVVLFGVRSVPFFVSEIPYSLVSFTVCINYSCFSFRPFSYAIKVSWFAMLVGTWLFLLSFFHHFTSLFSLLDYRPLNQLLTFLVFIPLGQLCTIISPCWLLIK